MWVLCSIFLAPSYSIEAMTHESTHGFHEATGPFYIDLGNWMTQIANVVLSLLLSLLEHQWKHNLSSQYVQLNGLVWSYHVRKVDQFFCPSTTIANINAASDCHSFLYNKWTFGWQWISRLHFVLRFLSFFFFFFFQLQQGTAATIHEQ